MRKSHLYIAAGLTLSFAALATPAHAQLNRSIATSLAYAADDQRSAYSDQRRWAYDNGYREGLKEGEKDGRRGDRFEFRDERTFRDGDKGYRRHFGDRDRYRQIFRSGYADGYQAAYDRWRGRGSGRWERDGRYRGNTGYGRPGYGGYGYSPAFEVGARDGYEKGVEDARKRRSTRCGTSGTATRSAITGANTVRGISTATCIAEDSSRVMNAGTVRGAIDTERALQTLWRPLRLAAGAEDL
jgi:hypothetical protein